jgi:hypothetical protein
MRTLSSLLRLAPAVLGVAAVCGCAWVTPAPTTNQPGAGQAQTSGAPGETLNHFQQVYPPKGWPPRNVRYRAAVCPLLISREAVILLAGESAQQVLAHAEAGNAKVTAVVHDRNDLPQFFVAEKLSDEGQSILMEELVNKGPFEVVHTSKSGFLANAFFEDLDQQGVPLCILGYLDPEAAGAKEVKCYVRVVDTATRAVRCAVSAQGATLADAVRQAGAKLVQSFNR